MASNLKRDKKTKTRLKQMRSKAKQVNVNDLEFDVSEEFDQRDGVGGERGRTSNTKPKTGMNVSADLQNEGSQKEKSIIDDTQSFSKLGKADRKSDMGVGLCANSVENAKAMDSLMDQLYSFMRDPGIREIQSTKFSYSISPDGMSSNHSKEDSALLPVNVVLISDDANCIISSAEKTSNECSENAIVLPNQMDCDTSINEIIIPSKKKLDLISILTRTKELLFMEDLEERQFESSSMKGPDMKDNSEIESIEAELSEINLNLTKRFTSFDQLEKHLEKLKEICCANESHEELHPCHTVNEEGYIVNDKDDYNVNLIITEFKSRCVHIRDLLERKLNIWKQFTEMHLTLEYELGGEEKWLASMLATSEYSGSEFGIKSSINDLKLFEKKIPDYENKLSGMRGMVHDLIDVTTEDGLMNLRCVVGLQRNKLLYIIQTSDVIADRLDKHLKKINFSPATLKEKLDVKMGCDDQLYLESSQNISVFVFLKIFILFLLLAIVVYILFPVHSISGLPFFVHVRHVGTSPPI